MSKLDPIIAVKDVEQSSLWYQQVFACKSIHGGSEFDVLVDENNVVIICLHAWNEHEHPSMRNPNITPGNGLILYLRTEKIDAIYMHLKEMEHTLDEDLHVSANSNKREFSFKDPNGYYWMISEFHNYQG